MHSPANGVHKSEGYPTIQLLLIEDNSDKTIWECVINGVKGQLTVTTDAGEPDGWDWEGPDTDDDTLQRALDCTAIHFVEFD